MREALRHMQSLGRLILDALLKAFEKRGYQVACGPTVTVMGVDVSFGISEILESKREEPEDHELEGRYYFGHSRYRETRDPSCRLSLKIDGPGFYWSGGCRQTWRDAKSPLEDRLPSFVQGLVKFAARVKQRQLEREKEEQQRKEARRRQEEEAKRRAEKRALIKAERKRVRELYRVAKNWKRSQTLREYIDAKRRNHEQRGHDSAPDSELAAWVAWASEQADRLDPLIESPPSILDEDTPELEEPDPWRRRT